MGPAVSEDRYIELWNLVFMQFDQRPDGTRVPLPKPCVDTGAGLERWLAVLQGVATVWDTDVFRPLIATAERVTGVAYGTFPGTDRDVSLRILAEHGRTMTFLVADGVVPSNEERGYVLRRIIRRAVRHAFLLGAEDLVTPALVDATVDVMGDAYPDLVKQHELIRGVVGREEERFRQTLARGVELLDGVLARGDVSGDDAFFLHDTLGFPIDLTREIAEEREPHRRHRGLRGAHGGAAHARQGGTPRRGGKSDAPVELYRELLDEVGPTDFTGRQEYETVGAKVRALIVGGERVAHADAGSNGRRRARPHAVLRRVRWPGRRHRCDHDGRGRRVRVLDTQYGLPGLVVHRGTVEEGTVAEGDEATAAIDGPRRDAIRRNHTATHVLHWALREVLGTHVKQAGSMVAPDRLRFDFSHHEAVTQAQLDAIEELANREIISDAPVRHYETTKEHAESLGAIAFFGDKYGDLVRVLEAGEHSIELCGGTHVHALGFIGPVKIVSEQSIGANLRRIEALTGEYSLARIHEEEVELRTLARVAQGRARRSCRIGWRASSEQVKSLADELAAERAKQAGAEAQTLAADAVDGVVVVRRDGLTNDDLRQLATATRAALGEGIVALIGLGPDGAKAGLVVAVAKQLVASGVSAADIAREAAAGARRRHGQERRARGGRRAQRRRGRRRARAVAYRRNGCAWLTPGARVAPGVRAVCSPSISAPCASGSRDPTRRARSPARSRCWTAAVRKPRITAPSSRPRVSARPR